MGRGSWPIGVQVTDGEASPFGVLGSPVAYPAKVVARR